MSSIEPLPPPVRSMWRTIVLGYRSEPRLLVVAFVLTLVAALPDALLALWLMLLANGVVEGDTTLVVVAAVGLGVSATATWFLRVISDRVTRRFRDRITIALEGHVAGLQASVATIEHHERPEYLDRLSMLRDQVFVLDHMFMSLFTSAGWILRLAITLVLLASIHPALLLLGLCALPTVAISGWRPGVERRVEEAGYHHKRLARHLFDTATSAPPGKELRVAQVGPRVTQRRAEAFDRWYRPVSSTRWVSAVWHTVGWAVFGLAYVGAIVFVASGLDASPGQVLLVLAAGSRLSAYLSAAVGEIGFLRGTWMEGSQRLAWFEDYVAAAVDAANGPVPDRLVDGVVFDRVTFAYPGTDRVVLDDVSLHLPAGAVVAIVGENGAGKTTLVKLLARMYRPDSGRILIDGQSLATMDNLAWRSRLGGAFQDFFRFELPARRSVGVGDLPRLDDDTAVGSAVHRAGADDVVAAFAHGLDTQLGPTWPGGVEVSFGQWQKLALARGFMRDQPLVQVLDEPTSALDAETEHALFEQYAAASRSGGEVGTITILVSHRFSTVRMADLIVVLDGAQVVEVGTHDELMARRGHYADLYTIQATAYR